MSFFFLFEQLTATKQYLCDKVVPALVSVAHGSFFAALPKRGIASPIEVATLFFHKPSELDRVRAAEFYFREGSTVAAYCAFPWEVGRRRATERRMLVRWVADFEGSGAPRGPYHTPRPSMPPCHLPATTLQGRSEQAHLAT